MVAQLTPVPMPIPARPPRADAAAAGCDRSIAAVRLRIDRLGVDGCSDDELLSVALAGAGARRLARRLVAEFGGLGGLAIAAADPAFLARRAGIGPGRAAQLAAIMELGRRAAVAWPTPGWQVRTPADVAERLMAALGRLEREELHVLTLNTKNTVTACERTYVGNLAGSSVRVGEVFRMAVRRQAAAIVVAHNHPSGDPAPSAEDLRITAEMAQAGRLLDIELLDHLVVGHGRWVSLRALGAF